MKVKCFMDAKNHLHLDYYLLYIVMKLKKGVDIKTVILRELKKISNIDHGNKSYKHWQTQLNKLSKPELEDFARCIADRSKKVELFLEVGETIPWKDLWATEKTMKIPKYTDVTLHHIEGGDVVQKNCMVLRINIERLKQIGYKKMSANVTGVKKYNPITGGDMNKKGVFTIPEIQGCEVLENTDYIKENILLQGDNPMATAEARRRLVEDGYVRLKDIEDNIVGRPVSASHVDEHFISAGIIPLVNNQVPIETHIENEKLQKRRSIKKNYGQ